MTVAWAVCHTDKPKEEVIREVPKHIIDSYKRCECCGKKVGVPWRVIDDLYFCKKSCYLRYFGG